MIEPRIGGLQHDEIVGRCGGAFAQRLQFVVVAVIFDRRQVQMMVEGLEEGQLFCRAAVRLLGCQVGGEGGGVWKSRGIFFVLKTGIK